MNPVKMLRLLLLLTLISSPTLRAAQAEVLYEMGRPLEIRLAADTNLVLSLENGFCSWKPAGQGTALQLQFVRGLANPTLASLEAVGQTNVFLRHFFLRLRTMPMPSRRDPLFEGDATFEVMPGVLPGTLVLRSANQRETFVARSHQNKAFVIPDPHPDAMQLVLRYK